MDLEDRVNRLREEADKDGSLPEGAYNLSQGDFVIMTGREGYIRYLAALEEAMEGLHDS